MQTEKYANSIHCLLSQLENWFLEGLKGAWEFSFLSKNRLNLITSVSVRVIPEFPGLPLTQ